MSCEWEAMAKHEHDLLKQITHPHVVKVLNNDLEWIDDTVSFCLEDGGRDLVARQVPFDRCKDVYDQIKAAMAHLHSRWIVHRDLKLDNVVADTKWHVRLIDFGFAMEVCNQPPTNPWDKTRMVGSPCYIAPEVWTDDSYDLFGVDAWALGMVLFAMGFTALPFEKAHAPSNTPFRLWKRRHVVDGKTPFAALCATFGFHGKMWAQKAPPWMVDEINRFLVLSSMWRPRLA
jgi:serine/threonine protein kinase